MLWSIGSVPLIVYIKERVVKFWITVVLHMYGMNKRILVMLTDQSIYLRIYLTKFRISNTRLSVEPCRYHNVPS